VEKRLAELKNQLGRMQFGSGLDLPDEAGATGQTRKEIFVPAVRVPRVGLDLARLLREVKIQETVFQLLTSQLEQAKIAEARDTPVVQVLDRAVVPDRKAKPRTLFNVAIAGLLSTFVGVFGAFFLEHVENARRRRAVYGLSGNGTSALAAESGQELPISQAKPLPAADADGVGDENRDAVDVRQLRFSPLATDGERTGADGNRASAQPARPGRAKK